MTTIIYSKGDYDLIEERNFDKNSFLSKDTLTIINDLTDQVSAPTYSKTPSFPSQSQTDKSVPLQSPSVLSYTSKYTSLNSSSSSSEIRSAQLHKNRGGQYSKSPGSSSQYKRTTSDHNKPDEKWRANKSTFQPTKLQRNKEGSKGIIEDIRLLLNKLTDKTYKKISEQIIEIVNTIESNEIKSEVTEQIIKVACTNNINCKSYAYLLKDVDNQLGVSDGTCITNTLLSYSNSFTELIGVSTSPDDDYDKFCEVNLCNNKRKGTSLFIYYLMVNNLVSVSEMIKLVQDMTAVLKSQLDKSDAVMCNEELAENIYVLSKHILENTEDKENRIFELIMSHDFALYTKNKYVGITQKAKFKIMDIMDIIKKVKK